MKNILIHASMILVLLLTACGNNQKAETLTEAAASGENRTTAAEMPPDIAPAMVSGTENSGKNQDKQDTAADIPETFSSNQENGDTASVTLTIGDKVYRARFHDNAAAEALMEQMPMELDMEELHGNEKYYYLSHSLPADTESIGSIRAGDIMLFGDDCLVLFYEDFQTTFSYTRIGRLEDSAGLADTLGSGGVRVSFDKAE